MVAVLHNAPDAMTPHAVSAWLDVVTRGESRETRERIEAALSVALPLYEGHLTDDGEPLKDRALGTATILVGLKLDADSICAAVLLGLPECGPRGEAALTESIADSLANVVASSVANSANTSVVDLVRGVARMNATRVVPVQLANAVDAGALQTENLRKMLLAMAEDMRVVLIKLAERAQALRFLVTRNAALRTRAAREALDLFAPLANRLGIWQLKWELEDLSLRALEPVTYKKIAAMLDERRLDRERYIEEVIAILERELSVAGVKAQVTGRPKHIYSIYQKMRRKQSGIDELYDIRAVRILVDEVADCYAALGVVHASWTPLSDEFDDYIAKPKANDYRSLHTAVIGPGGKSLEVQIRTHEMHRHSELGIAAHWRYKEGRGNVRRPDSDSRFTEKVAWLRQVVGWKDALVGAGETPERKSAPQDETIYVLTPQGKIVELPKDATPVDFAYAVHTSLGHRCRGARVDDVMVPLNYALRTGVRVEIIAAKEGGPSRDWLNAEPGYLKSNRARAKVRQWFKAQQLADTVAQGRAIVERELQRAGATTLSLDALAAHAGYAKLDDFFAAAGRAEVNTRDVQMAIQATRASTREASPSTVATPENPVALLRESRAATSGSGILIVGVDRLMTGLARCCKPAPPDAIVGFVSRGKGITIHRRTCGNVARMREGQPERLIAAEWGTSRDEVFPVDIQVDAVDRERLLHDISEGLSRQKINVTAVRTTSRKSEARTVLTVEVKSVGQLDDALSMMREVPGVVAAARC